MKRTLLAGIAFFGMNSLVHADIVAGGPGYGGPSQAIAVCYLFNMGPSVVNITSVQLLREFNVNLPLTVNNCGATLPAGRSCGFATPIVNNQAHMCRAVVTPSGAKNRIRGTLEFRDAAGNVLSNTEVR